MPNASTDLRQPAAQGPERLDRSRFLPKNRKRLSAPGMRTFLAIADLWGLNVGQRLLILGCPAQATFHKWAKTAREHGELVLDVDTLTRISAMLGIHRALGILHGSEQEGIAWLRTPHRATIFGGRPPLDLVTSGTQDGLMNVRRFLDAARGGIYMAPVDALDRDFQPYRDEDLVIS